MIIEFELQGSHRLHQGIFDTNGFWVRREVHVEEDERAYEKVVGYSLYSHFSFSFYHEDETIVDQVYRALCYVIEHNNPFLIDEIGYLKPLND